MNLSQILKRSFVIKQGEKILVVTDKKQLKIAKKFFGAAKKLSKNARLLLKPIGRHDGEEPSPLIAKAMCEADIALLITKYSLSHTKARKNASRAGARIASLPRFTEEMFTALQTDPFLLRKKGEKIINILNKTDKIHILTKSGTDLSFSIRNRKIFNDCGLYRKKGSFGNLPAGEVCLAPLEGTANGIVVIDSIRDGKEVFAKPKTIITVKKGKAVAISDNNCKLAKYFRTIKNSRNIAEFGIGTNHKARIIGYILQDEKAVQTCHIAFGNNKSFGGKVYSSLHLDAIIFKPTIYADDRLIMKNGKQKI